MEEKNIRINIETAYTTTGSEQATEAAAKIGNEVKASGSQFGIMDTQLGKVWKSITSGVSRAVVSFRSLAGAIASTGILLLVVAVGSLIAYFKKTEEGAGKLRVIMAALGQVINVVVDTFVKIGETLIKIAGIIGKVVKGTSTFKEGWQETKTVVKDAIDTVAESYRNLGATVEKAIELAERENQLKKDKRKLLSDEATATVELAKLNEIIIDQSLTNEERQKAIAKATDISNKLFDEKIRLAKEDYELQKQRNALASSSEDDLDKEAQLLATLIGLEAERSTSQRRYIMTGSRLREENRKEREKELLETEKFLKELQEANMLALLDGQEKELTIEDLHYIELQKRAKGNKDILLEIEKQHIRNVEAIRQEYRDRQEIADKTQSDKELAQAAKDNEEFLANFIRNNEEQLRIDEELANARIEIQYRVADNYAAVGNLLSQIANENKGLAITGLILEKVAAIASIIINTKRANAATTAWGRSLGPVGIVVAKALNTKNNISTGIAIAAIIAQTASSISQINSAGKEKKAARGTPYSLGGITLVGEEGPERVFLPKGTQVLTASTTRQQLAGIPQLTEERVIQLITTSLKSIPVVMSDDTAYRTGRAFIDREKLNARFVK